MTDPTGPQTPEQEEPTLRRIHQVILVGLGVCAIVILAQPSSPEPVPPARLTVTAVSLAVATIFARALSGSPQMPRQGRWLFGLLTLLCAGGIGVTGLVAGIEEGARQIGLGLTLGAAILALRCPDIRPRPRS